LTPVSFKYFSNSPNTTWDSGCLLSGLACGTLIVGVGAVLDLFTTLFFSSACPVVLLFGLYELPILTTTF
jgi:hypothetical protein